MRVGLDFGTTNSSAALLVGDQVRLLRLDPRNRVSSIMRSTLFITRDGVPFIGREAIDRFTEANVGRTIDYQWRHIGQAEVTFADVGTVDQALFTLVDANVPGRLFQSLKSHLADAAFTDTDVFGTRYTLETLIAVVLRLILRRIENEVAQPITHIVVGRPVRYSHDERHDRLAIDRMRQACALAGLPAIDMVPEPSAAALGYVLGRRTEEHVLVLDFGGGTFDVTVLHLGDDGQMTVLATEGTPIGGDLVDRRIVAGPVAHYFGVGATMGPARLPIPAVIHDHLREWQSIVELNQPRFLTIIDEAVRTGDRKTELMALRALVRENYGLPLYEAVERAKVRLSDRPMTGIVMNVPGIRFAHDLTRAELDALIGPDIRQVGACIDRALAAAGLRRGDIDTVLRTGGSSHLGAYVVMLAEMFGEERLREMATFTGVAAGLGIAAARPDLLERMLTVDGRP